MTRVEVLDTLSYTDINLLHISKQLLQRLLTERNLPYSQYPIVTARPARNDTLNDLDLNDVHIGIKYETSSKQEYSIFHVSVTNEQLLTVC